MPTVSHPNILIAVFDSLSPIDSCSSSISDSAPNIVTLGDEGAVFASAYTPCPESSPARASLFTGLDPFVHGLWTNGVHLPEHVPTFPKMLAQAGYASWLVGRYQLAGVANWTTEHMRPGEYRRAEWAHGPLHRSRQNAYHVWLRQRAPDHYDRIFPFQADPDDTHVPVEQSAAISGLPDELSFNHWVGERIVDMISSHSPDRPFLAVAGFCVGDSKGAQPTDGNDAEGLDERALRQADQSLGRMMEELACGGRSGNSVVIVTAGRGHVARPATDRLLQESLIRVPLVIRFPEFDRQVIDAPVSTMDVAPTILDIAGLQEGQHLQGMSLLDVLDGSKPPRGWAMSRLRRGSTSLNRHWQTALRSGTMKLVAFHGTPQSGIPVKFKMFDLSTDPDERDNLAENPAHAVALEAMIDLMIDARCALEDRTEPRIANY